MTWVVPLALGSVAILLMAVFTMLSARKRHRAIVAPAATVGPRILVHDINDDRCTGCDACVAVCPTNVLDLVSNKSRVLRFHDCIQCEACMFACPTEALVMFPQGGVPPALKVPEIDENFQTAVPGQYLIGEVAGKPLVKNAANLGRAVVEHMLATGLTAGALGGGDNAVDVAIIGSGPGGLSAALTCIQRGLSYVVLEKEQMIASTIARYPKGKLVMAEPYDTQNMSFLPVFDSGKEQLIPIWRELIERVGLVIKQGESVETVTRGSDGVFEVRSTVATYRAQRAVLSIGTRGKPRTLQVPGENLPKVYSLLEDPDDWRGKAVLVVGGGDSACEAALALADAGAKVMISYRGKGFNRAAPKNKQAIEGYAAQGKVKSKLGSQVINFEADSVTLALADGSQKRYPNDATFVLIGADPPIAWLEKMGVRFVERPHQYQLGKTDDIVRKFVGHAVECPEDAARAAAQVLGGSIGVEPAPPVQPPTVGLPMPMGEPVSGPRKWLRSATSIFSNRLITNSGHPDLAPLPVAGMGKADARGQRAKKFDAPVPLSEFARRGKASMHSHNGRRDALTAGERTRILRMLRDEGGRIADEDSRVYIGAAPADLDYEFDFDDGPGPAPLPLRADVPAKPAVVVGIAQAQAARTNQKRASAAHQSPRPSAIHQAPPQPMPQQPMLPQQPMPQPMPPQVLQPPMQQPPPRMTAPQFAAPRVQPAPPLAYPPPLAHPPPPSLAPSSLAPPLAPPVLAPPQSHPPPPAAPPQAPPRQRSRQISTVQPPPAPPPRRQAPSFNEEPTRQVDDALLEALRKAPPAKAAPKPAAQNPTPKPAAQNPTNPTPKPTPRPTPKPASNGARPLEARRPEPPMHLPPEAALPIDESPAATTAWPGHNLAKPGPIRASHDEPTRMAKIDHLGFSAPPPLDGGIDSAFDGGLDGSDEMTRPADDFASRLRPAVHLGFEDHNDPEEATRLASLDSMAALERARAHGQLSDDRTRPANTRQDPSISDVDWDLD